jgi:hypothetical protein
MLVFVGVFSIEYCIGKIRANKAYLPFDKKGKPNG